MEKSKRKNYRSTLLDRSTIIAILNAAISTASTKFARRAASAWLNVYRGDLAVEYFKAQSYLKDDLAADAIPLLKQICYTDPEYMPAQRLLAYSSNHAQYASVATAQGCIAALGGNVRETGGLPAWADLLTRARRAGRENKVAQAEALFQQTLAQQPDTPLPAVLHLKFAVENYDWKTIHDLGQRYIARWPDALACILIHADTLTTGGHEDQAVNLLHRAVSLDIGGQVAIQLWGTQHPYRDLWPANPQINLDIPIPAAVASTMGWNQLPAGSLSHAGFASAPKASQTAQPKSQEEVQLSNQVIDTAKSEFEKLAAKLKKSDLGKGDGRFPAYILLTTQQGLENQYGSENLAKIDAALRQVVHSTQALHNWNAYLVYVDEAKCTDQFGLPPSKPKDAWSIKTFIAELDHRLSRRGEMIGAILIVGGPKVVPFHHLPNPIDDFDVDVPSDNPYACNDENYFIPAWPVGRLPGSDGRNPAPLLAQLNQIVHDRSQQMLKEKRSPISRIFENLRKKFSFRPKKHSFGYSAEVWQRAAHSVYRPIGKPHTLVISPPTHADYFVGRRQKPSRLAYYNLHGLEDAPEWYGQRDPIETINGPDYPIALRPQDIQNSGRAPHIVFSEACFGANIFRKSVEDAIALKFLDSGTKAVVGSTCTSYGSIAPPLIAADLLGKAFWSYLKDGFPAGEALRRSKIHLAKEMNNRQGYLDGEDQKTLVSFVLYGDPLAQPDQLPDYPSGKSNLRLTYNSDNLKTICDKVNQPDQHAIPPEVVRQVKAVVKQYLPGMSDAQVLFSQEHVKCSGHDCPTHQLGAKSTPARHPTRKVVTLSKRYDNGAGSHHQHARITINAEGKMIKLAVSR